MINAFDYYFLQKTPVISPVLLELITFFADPKVNLLFWGLISLFFLINKKSDAVFSKPFYFFVLTNFVMLICGVIKICFGRARPFLIDANMAGFYFFSVKHAFLSFPSSHTAIAAAFSYACKKMYKINNLIFLFPVLIMGTRLSLREHFATDVLAGFVIGILISTFLSKYYLKVVEKGFSILKFSQKKS